jgi:hypothetical protein
MKTIGLTFKDAKKDVEKVEKPVEITKTPKKPIKKASAEIEPDGEE